MSQRVGGVWLRGLTIALLTTGAIGWSGSSAAQNITLDGTLGRSGTLTGPFYLIQPADGRTVGRNLFHSFGRFNLTSTEAAFFLANPDIRNILARVTGGTRSTIDGFISTLTPDFQIAGVNVFLINPSGILFGPNASIDVGSASRGSFVATTTDALIWPDGSRFSATTPNSGDSLLRIVGDPSGFLATQRNLRPIEIRGNATQRSTLGVYPGQSLVLLGGDVLIDRGSLNVGFSVNGRIELGGIAASGTVGLTSEGNELRLGFPQTVSRANVAIANDSIINLRADSGSSLSIQAGNLDINRSRLFAGIGFNLGGQGSQAGDVNLNVTGALTIRGESEISNDVNPGGTGNAGNVLVSAGSLAITDGSVLRSSTFAAGNAGQIAITVQGQTLIDGGDDRIGGGIYSTVEQRGTGKGGNIQLKTGSLSVLRGGQFIASSIGRGDGGNINITVSNQAILDGTQRNGFSSGVFSNRLVNPQLTTAGNAGNISLTLGSLVLSNGADIAAEVFGGLGQAGNITIQARDRVTIGGLGPGSNPSAISSFSANLTSNPVSGNAVDLGNIKVLANDVIMTDGSLLTTSAIGQANAGNITVQARNTLNLGSRALVTSNVGNPSADRSQGRVGSISLEGRSIALTGNSQIQAGFFRNAGGQPGTVTVRATEAITFSGLNSGIFANVDPGGLGDGSNIQLQAPVIQLTDRAVVLANNRGLGKGGDITLDARDRLVLDRGFINAGAVSRGGNIDVTTNQLQLENNGTLEVSSLNQGQAGNITVNANSIRANQGRIFSQTAAGDGGNITLNLSDSLLLRRGSQISTTAGTARAGGNGGNITINSPNGFIVGVLSENSDITANAFTGNGGNVNITAQGIYGLQFQPRLTPNSDITASSEFGFNGTVTLNIPDTDPSRGFISLPIDLSDPTTLLDTRCQPGSRGYASSYIETGRSGIPASPDDLFTADPALPNWVIPPTPTHPTTPTHPHPHTPTNPLTEANTLLRAPNGDLYLVASRSLSPQDFWRPPIDCSGDR